MATNTQTEDQLLPQSVQEMIDTLDEFSSASLVWRRDAINVCECFWDCDRQMGPTGVPLAARDRLSKANETAKRSRVCMEECGETAMRRCRVVRGDGTLPLPVRDIARRMLAELSSLRGGGLAARSRGDGFPLGPDWPDTRRYLYEAFDGSDPATSVGNDNKRPGAGRTTSAPASKKHDRIPSSSVGKKLGRKRIIDKTNSQAARRKLNIYQLIAKRKQPGVGEKRMVGELKADKQFAEQVKQAGLKLNENLVKAALRWHRDNDNSPTKLSQV